jgi:hypothetical protein
MTITLSPEHEQLISEAIRAGLIHTPDEALDEALATLRQRLRSRGAKPTPAQAAERLATFGQRHQLSLGGLSIKDLITEGRA